MHYGPWEVVDFIDSSTDGSTLLGRSPGTGDVLLRVLEVPPSESLRKRLRLLAGLSDPSSLHATGTGPLVFDTIESSHPEGLRAVLGMDLDASPVWIAQSAPRGAALSEMARESPMDALQLLTLAHDLAQALAALHRLGIVLGNVDPTLVEVTDEGRGRLDATGLRTLSSSLEQQSWRAACLPGTSSEGTREGDIWSLGACLLAASTGAPADIAALGTRQETIVDAWVLGLLRQLMAEPASSRPSAEQVERHLHSLLQEATTHETVAVGSRTLSDVLPSGGARKDIGPGSTLGRFRLEALVGAGGMGEVYRAVDTGDNSIVAVKVMMDLPGEAATRFQKEARLLGRIRSPYIANLVEVNSDGGVQFMAMELVDGLELDAAVEKRGQLSERVAIAIVSDIARALLEAHRLGIVHRDIKPSNVLLDGAKDSDLSDRALLAARIKLIDFGIARQVEQSASMELTRTGSTLGSPLYMSPEQCGGGTVTPAADVYSLCATLFRLVSGRPVFEGDSILSVILAQVQTPPPLLSETVASASPALEALLQRGLSKAPSDRFPDAEALLEALESIAHGVAADIRAHPRLPDHDASQLQVTTFHVDLEASADRLWPYVSNTDRLNQLIGLPAVDYAVDRKANIPRHVASTRLSGMRMQWTEHPHEWVEGQRFSILREFESGPVAWYVNGIALDPRQGGGTRIRQDLKVMPRNVVGKAVAAAQGWKLRRGLTRAYNRIDSLLQGRLSPQQAVNPFGEVQPLSSNSEQRLAESVDQLLDRQVSSEVIACLQNLIRGAHPLDAARVRPYALADRHDLDRDAVANGLLHAADLGLFRIMWDIVCPTCQVPSQIQETMKALEDHGHCDACDIDFALDFANSVELIFRVDPSLRETDLKVYCMGGPQHAPHVVAQVKVDPGERFVLPLQLEEGAFRVRSSQLPEHIDVRVRYGAALARLEVVAESDGWVSSGAVDVLPEQQTLVIVNERAHEILVRLERRASFGDALTAARASTMSVFRELFPNEVLDRGRLVTIEQCTFLLAELCGAAELFHTLGDAAAFAKVDGFFANIRDEVARCGGAVIKAVGLGGLVAVFHHTLDAVQAAEALPRRIGSTPETADLPLRIAVHQGPAVVANLDDRLDYFGTAIATLYEVCAETAPGQVFLSETVAAEGRVVNWLREVECATTMDTREAIWGLLLGGGDS